MLNANVKDSENRDVAAAVTADDASAEDAGGDQLLFLKVRRGATRRWHLMSLLTLACRGGSLFVFFPSTNRKRGFWGYRGCNWVAGALSCKLTHPWHRKWRRGVAVIVVNVYTCTDSFVHRPWRGRMKRVWHYDVQFENLESLYPLRQWFSIFLGPRPKFVNLI